MLALFLWWCSKTNFMILLSVAKHVATVQGEPAKIRKQSKAVLDATRMGAENANYEDLKDAVHPQDLHKAS